MDSLIFYPISVLRFAITIIHGSTTTTTSFACFLHHYCSHRSVIVTVPQNVYMDMLAMCMFDKSLLVECIYTLVEERDI